VKPSWHQGTGALALALFLAPACTLLAEATLDDKGSAGGGGGAGAAPGGMGGSAGAPGGSGGAPSTGGGGAAGGEAGAGGLGQGCPEDPEPEGIPCPEPWILDSVARRCDLECNGSECTDAARKGIILCPPGNDCRVSCLGNESCEGLEIQCSDKRCEVICDAQDACNGVTVRCGTASCEVTCHTPTSSCNEMSLECLAGYPCAAECDANVDEPQVSCNDACECTECD
jgi:hypothetical protein